MIASEIIEQLHQAMTMRLKLSRTEPDGFSDLDNYILFLGSGCAKAANVPSFSEIARKVFDAYEGVNQLSLDVPSKEERSDEDKLLKSFFKFLGKMSHTEIFLMLQSFFADIPVPTFYQDLALLVKDGYFNRILTTNFDTLLEQALNGVGLQIGFNYQVISLGGGSTSDDESSSDSNATGSLSNMIYIIKLHGDISKQDMNFTPQNIEQALQSQRRFVKSELQGDLIMVGYKFESEPINQWLNYSQRQELWWVDSHPKSTKYNTNDWANQIFYMDENLARPETFFSQLALRLLRRPAYESLRKNSLRSYIQQGTDSGQEDYSGETVSTDEELIVEDLRVKIRSSQALLNSLEQSAPPGERAPSIQAQIDYQRRQIIRLEDDLRSLSNCREKLLTLLETIRAVVPRAAAESNRNLPSKNTLTFLNKLLEFIRKELQAGAPNQYILASSIAAVLTLLERYYLNLTSLPADSETATACQLRDLIRELANFAPSIATRG
jgi:hypothetical protein